VEDAAEGEVERLRREVEELRRAVAALASARSGVADGASSVGRATAARVRFAEIDVERVNVIEPDGRRRLVLTNRDRSPDIALDGRGFKRVGPNPTGLLFYNDDGDECGALIYGGHRDADGRYSAAANLLFDQFQQDQTVGIRYNDSNGEREGGLQISDWVAAPALPRTEMLDRWETVRQLPQGPERSEAMAALREAGFFSTPRVFVGRLRDGSTTVRLHDLQGRVRIRLTVDSTGVPSLQFLDEAGEVTFALPGSAAGPQTAAGTD
jgi:hypothetical protein